MRLPELRAQMCRPGNRDRPWMVRKLRSAAPAKRERAWVRPDGRRGRDRGGGAYRCGNQQRLRDETRCKRISDEGKLIAEISPTGALFAVLPEVGRRRRKEMTAEPARLEKSLALEPEPFREHLTDALDGALDLRPPGLH